MKPTKIDITSTILEKGLDLAKDFLDKLISPTIEETGLLIKDNITFWRIKNQVRTLNRTKEYCELNNISIKTISLKLLCPLLESASIEDNEILQDKWAILLSNLIDSEQNIENHVFPYILSQISLTEFDFLKTALISKKDRITKLKNHLEDLKKKFPIEESKYKIELEKLDFEINSKKENGFSMYSSEILTLQSSRDNLYNQLRNLGLEQRTAQIKLYEPEIVPEHELREFEIANLVRLGLIKFTQQPFIHPRTLDIPNSTNNAGYLNIKLDIDVQSIVDYVLTELGELFIEACTEKNKK